MPGPSISSEDLWALYESNGRNAYKTAQQLGMDKSGIAKRLQRLRKEKESEGKVVLPTFPDDDVPTKDIVAFMARRYKQRWEHQQAKKWFEVGLPNAPFGLMMWGDPHLDSNGCNWPLLEKHIQISKNPGIYSINIGDTLDNWPHGSRLIKLYAHSDQSTDTARRLADYFFTESGIQWLVVLLGNHDLWPGHNNIKSIVKKPVVVEDWGARFVLKAGNTPFRIWACHNFPGHSEHNTLHGLQKTATKKEECDLYVAGHTHNWAIHQEESASRGFVYWLCRTRGYKYIDDHAMHLGHDPQEEGASVLAVCNPRATSMSGRIQLFADVEVGADYLKWLRK